MKGGQLQLAGTPTLVDGGGHFSARLAGGTGDVIEGGVDGLGCQFHARGAPMIRKAVLLLGLFLVFTCCLAVIAAEVKHDAPAHAASASR